MDGRLITTADVLRVAADSLKFGERAREFVAMLFAEPDVIVARLPADLLMIAAWLDEHPEVDEQIRTVLALEVET